jgi:DNA damage-inducible protein 1
MRSFRAQLFANEREQATLQHRLYSNPFDAEAQKRIEEAIRQHNIAENMETAMEYHPESFGSVTMLYVLCKVNGKPIKAFVDCGAQTTISKGHLHFIELTFQ